MFDNSSPRRFATELTTGMFVEAAAKIHVTLRNRALDGLSSNRPILYGTLARGAFGLTEH